MAGRDVAYFIYARKSTDTEEKQVHSIDSQLAELRAFADRNGLRVVGEHVEKRSAKAPGRPVFDGMLRAIEGGEASGILAWHPDRLARNAVDGGRIIYMLDTGALADLKFPCWSFESTPQGKLSLNGAFGYSKYYVDALAENVRCGMDAKIRRGDFPGKAPLGYLNDRRKKQIVVDRERAPIVREAFELYAGRSATLLDVRRLLAERGVRASGGGLVGNAYVSRMLSNPIYYGHFKFYGEVHEGRHEPIITKELFDRVQAVFARRWRNSPSEKERPAKAYTGLLRCEECGCAITAETQKGHVYYRCTKKNRARPCSQGYLREEELDVQVASLISPFALRPDWADAMLARLDAEREEDLRRAREAAARKDAEAAAIRAQLGRLTDALVDGLIGRDEFAERKAALMGRKRTLEEESGSLTRSPALRLEPLRRWIMDAKNIGEIAKTGSPSDRKEAASKVFGSNLVMGGKKARGEATNPWRILAVNECNSRWVTVLTAARTYFIGQ